MPEAVRCPVCGAAVAGAVLCTTCTGEVAEALSRVRWLTAQLDVLLRREDRTSERTAGGSPEPPLPYDVRASQAADRLHGALARWARVVGADGARYVASVGLAEFIAARTGQLRQLHDAGRAHADLTDAVARAERIIDLPPERWFAGPCDNCGEDAYALPGSALVRCRCGWRADAAERRRWLLQAAEDTLVTAALAAQALSRLGQPVTGAMVRGYVFRGRLTAHGTDRLGRPLYRIGDLLDILTSS